MAKVTYIDITEILPRMRPKTIEPLREEIREQLRRLQPGDKGLRLEMDEDERSETVQRRYREAAEGMGLRLEFRTLTKRTFQTRNGTAVEEAATFTIHIKPTLPPLTLRRHG